MLPPLIFVISASMIKDAYEDYQRHKDDDKENGQTAHIAYLETQFNIFKPSKWKHVQVGDIVRVNENEFIPADMVLL